MSRIKATLFLFTTLFAITAQADSTNSPTALHTFKHWPAISNLIEYRDRIWFVHSNPYEDTNVADIYSYNPTTNTTQFERSLFSQDSGTPVVHNGLLHWPLEDPRRSAGVGEYVVTDGQTWQWQVMNSGKAMHVHALESCGNELIAVTGSWTGQYLVQDKTNNKWQLNFDYPAGQSSFSRLVDAEYFDASCYLAGAASKDPQVRLLKMVDGVAESVKGWPASDRVDGLTTHGNNLYAWSDLDSKRTLHSYDGTAIKNIAIQPQHQVRGLYSTGPTLYMITSSGKTGALWTLNNRQQFTLVNNLPFVPLSLISTEQHGVFVGSYNRKGPSLWQIKTTITQKLNKIQPTLITQTSAAMTAAEIESVFTQLRNVIVDPANGANRARNLRNALARPNGLSSPAFGQVLTRLLQVPVPDATLTLFTSRQAQWRQLVQWYLLSNIAINGHGYIDPTLLNAEFNSQPTRSNKYFDPSIMAIVATGWVKQNDNATIAALINRLTQSKDPLWLQSDISGALTAITGQRFGLDKLRWQQWHEITVKQ